MAKNRSGKHHDGRLSERRRWYSRLNPFSRRSRRGQRGFLASLWERSWQAIAHWLSWPFFALGGAFRWTLDSLVAFWSSREFRRLLWGMPFLLLVIGWGYLLVASTFYDQASVDQEYGKAAAAAFSEKNFEAARLYTERVARTRPNDHELLFRLANICSSLGDQDRYQSLMDRLAPPDKPVYGPAHLAMGTYLLTHEPRDVKSFQLAQAQLLQAAAADPKNTTIRATLGQVYFQMGWWEEAEKHLRLAVEAVPDLYLVLAKCLAFQAKRDQAALYGKRAETFLQQRVNENPLDQPSRMALADTLAFLEQFERAVATLQQGLTLKDTPELRGSLAKVYLLWADTVGDKTQDDRRRQFQLLELGLCQNPNDIVFFDRMMRILAAEDDVSRQARHFLVDNLAKGEARLLSHLILGTYEGERGRLEQATMHMQSAYELDPNVFIVANNLAWFLSEANPPQLDKALALIHAAMKIQPDRPEMLDTRGQILAKKGEWRFALRDLEAALPSMRDNRRLHETLSLCYRNLGSNDLAQKHAQIAATLAKNEELARPK